MHKPHLILLPALLFSGVLHAETLTTPSYIITLTNLCEEGTVGCDDIQYVAVNRKNNKAIFLKGRDLMHPCPDDQGDGRGKTPCHHTGYEFINGKTRYLVTDDGMLEVRQGARLVVREQGIWSE